MARHDWPDKAWKERCINEIKNTYKMPFGQYKGRHLKDIPKDYLIWYLDNVGVGSKNVRKAIKSFIN